MGSNKRCTHPHTSPGTPSYSPASDESGSDDPSEDMEQDIWKEQEAASWAEQMEQEARQEKKKQEAEQTAREQEVARLEEERKKKALKEARQRRDASVHEMAFIDWYEYRAEISKEEHELLRIKMAETVASRGKKLEGFYYVAEDDLSDAEIMEFCKRSEIPCYGSMFRQRANYRMFWMVQMGFAFKRRT